MSIMISFIQLFIIFFDAALSADFILKFNGYQWKYKKFFYCLVPVQFCITIFCNKAMLFSVLEIFLVIIISILFTFMLKQSSLFKRFLSCILFYGTLVGVNSIVLYLFKLITGTDFMQLIRNVDSIHVIMLVISKIALFSISRLFIRFTDKANVNFKITDIIMLFLMPIINISILGIMVSLSIQYDFSAEQSMLNMLLVMGVFLSNLIGYYFFVKMNRAAQTEIDYRCLQQQFAYEKKYMLETKELYEKVRRIKHDMKNYLLIIENHIKTNDNKNALEMISQVNSNINSIYNYINTSSDILNFIVNTKLSIAQEYAISVRANVEQIDLNMLNASEICSLLGNMLDNAIEACQSEIEKEIHLKIYQERGYQVISVKNRIASSVLNTNSDLTTTKSISTEHGFGLKQIRSIVQKKEGDIDIYEEGKMFCVNVFIPNEK